jgi:hypothetical protein
MCCLNIYFRRIQKPQLTQKVAQPYFTTHWMKDWEKKLNQIWPHALWVRCGVLRNNEGKWTIGSCDWCLEPRRLYCSWWGGLSVSGVGKGSFHLGVKTNRYGTDIWDQQATTGFRGGKETWRWVGKSGTSSSGECTWELGIRPEVGFLSCDSLEEPLLISM